MISWQLDGPAGAPVVVALHAIATHRALWTAQAAVWSSTWRVLRLDLPGHGASPGPSADLSLADYADQVVAVLDEAQVPRGAFVGLSFGGMIAQAIALGHPQRVTALVLAHTSARTEAPVREIWERRLGQFQRHGLAAQVEPTLDRWFTRSFAQASPLTLRWVGEQIAATSPAGYASAVRAIQALDHLDRLAEVRVPTLVIAGEADAAVPPAAAAALADRIPGAELVVLPHAAHLGNVEQPVAFTETVGRFLHDAMPTNERGDPR
jgi:3-oxoadipate enol-lactonase